jgi:8-oxo-dGTP pyrophosphatase MutT (NUDIX family)
MTAADWRRFEARVRRRLSEPLPGPHAQRRFAPQPVREAWAPDLEPATARRAAVLIVIYPADAGPIVTLTLRHRALARHAGQVSFPGGAVEAGESPAEAALREAHEELGVRPAEIRLAGALSTLWVDVSNFVVHPFVGLIDHRPAFTLDPGEVEALVEAPLATLCDPSRRRVSRRIRDGQAIDYPYIDVEGHQIWGATAMKLGELGEILDEILSGWK